MRKLIWLSGFLAVLTILSMVRGYFFTFNGIDAEFYEDPVASPNGNYSARTFYEYYGGAAGGVNAVVEIIDHTKDDTERIIYYADAQNVVRLSWQDEQTLYISNENIHFPDGSRNVTLNIINDIYHDTGRACRSLLLKNTYTHCHSKALSEGERTKGELEYYKSRWGLQVPVPDDNKQIWASKPSFN